MMNRYRVPCCHSLLDHAENFLVVFWFGGPTERAVNEVSTFISLCKCHGAAAIAHHFHAANVENGVLKHRHWYCKEADGAKMRLRPLGSLAVQLLILQLGRTFLACLLVLLAMDLLAVHATVFHEEAGVAVLELDGVTAFLATVGTGVRGFRRVDGNAAHIVGLWQ